jgi:hypothetical protein
MKNPRFVWSILGILFWGLLLSVIWVLAHPKENILIVLIKNLFFMCIFLLIIQFYIGGFPRLKPKTHFFLPAICFLAALVIILIESLFTGNQLEYLKILF